MLLAEAPPAELTAKIGRPSAYVHHNILKYGEAFAAETRPGSGSWLVTGEKFIRLLSTPPISEFWSEEKVRSRQNLELNASCTLSTATGAHHLALRRTLASSYRARIPELPGSFAENIIRETLASRHDSAQAALEEITARVLSRIFLGTDLPTSSVALTVFLRTLIRATLSRRGEEDKLHTQEYRMQKKAIFEDLNSYYTNMCQNITHRTPLFLRQVRLAHTTGLVQSTDDALSCLVMPFLAGVGQVSTTLAFTLAGVLSQSKYRECVLSEIPRKILEPMNIHLPALNAHLCEAMRLYPTAPIVQVDVRKDIVFEETLIAAGSRLLVAMTGPYHLACNYEDPLEYKPNRWEQIGSLANARLSLSFGLAPHRCMSEHLAKTLVIALAALLLKFEAVTLKTRDPGGSFELSESFFPASLRLNA